MPQGLLPGQIRRHGARGDLQETGDERQERLPGLGAGKDQGARQVRGEISIAEFVDLKAVADEFTGHGAGKAAPGSGVQDVHRGVLQVELTVLQEQIHVRADGSVGIRAAHGHRQQYIRTAKALARGVVEEAASLTGPAGDPAHVVELGGDDAVALDVMRKARQADQLAQAHGGLRMLVYGLIEARQRGGALQDAFLLRALGQRHQELLLAGGAAEITGGVAGARVLQRCFPVQVLRAGLDAERHVGVVGTRVGGVHDRLRHRQVYAAQGVHGLLEADEVRLHHPVHGHPRDPAHLPGQFLHGLPGCQHFIHALALQPPLVVPVEPVDAARPHPFRPGHVQVARDGDHYRAPRVPGIQACQDHGVREVRRLVAVIPLSQDQDIGEAVLIPRQRRTHHARNPAQAHDVQGKERPDQERDHGHDQGQGEADCQEPPQEGDLPRPRQALGSHLSVPPEPGDHGHKDAQDRHERPTKRAVFAAGLAAQSPTGETHRRECRGSAGSGKDT